MLVFRYCQDKILIQKNVFTCDGEMLVTRSFVGDLLPCVHVFPVNSAIMSRPSCPLPNLQN